MNLTNLAAMAGGKQRRLADFLDTCSPDSSTRTMAAATLALSLWQRMGRTSTPLLPSLLPSLLLVNAGAAEADPLDHLANALATGMDDKEPRESHATRSPLSPHRPKLSKLPTIWSISSRVSMSVSPARFSNTLHSGPKETSAPA